MGNGEVLSFEECAIAPCQLSATTLELSQFNSPMNAFAFLGNSRARSRKTGRERFG